jgi:hypothetical protein
MFLPDIIIERLGAHPVSKRLIAQHEFFYIRSVNLETFPKLQKLS